MNHDYILQISWTIELSFNSIYISFCYTSGIQIYFSQLTNKILPCSIQSRLHQLDNIVIIQIELFNKCPLALEVMGETWPVSFLGLSSLVLDSFPLWKRKKREDFAFPNGQVAPIIQPSNARRQLKNPLASPLLPNYLSPPSSKIAFCVRQQKSFSTCMFKKETPGTNSFRMINCTCHTLFFTRLLHNTFMALSPVSSTSS